MVGTLTVQNLQGPASGANAGKIIIPSGHTLDASAGLIPPDGSIIQVSNAQTTTYQTWISTSWINIWTPSFTPLSSSSTLHFIVSMNYLPEASNAYDTYMDWNNDNGVYYYAMSKAASITGWIQGNFCVTYSAPSGTTSAAQLRIQSRGNGANTSYHNYPGTGNNARSSVTMFEVAG